MGEPNQVRKHQTPAGRKEGTLASLGATYLRTMRDYGAAEGFKQCMNGIQDAIDQGIDPEEIRRALWWPPERAGEDMRPIYMGTAAALVNMATTSSPVVE